MLLSLAESSAKFQKARAWVVHTRPEHRSGEIVSNSLLLTPVVSAARKKVRMIDNIDYIGMISGINAAVYGSTAQGTAQKMLSLAGYLLATNGQSLPGITVWQYTHLLPYEDGILEEIHHDLFFEVDCDESLM